MATISDIHCEIVKELQEKFGEVEIYNPTSRSFLYNSKSTPDVYIKGVIFPSEDFVSGIAFKERDGTISILQDHLTCIYTGYTIDQLGLCDPVLWYENIKLLKNS